MWWFNDAQSFSKKQLQHEPSTVDIMALQAAADGLESAGGKGRAGRHRS